MNKIYYNDELIENTDIPKFNITIKGDNNIVNLYEFSGNATVYIYIEGDNCKFNLGKNNIIKNDIGINFWSTTPLVPNGSEITIGNNNFFNGTNISLISPLFNKICIGNGNLFAGDISFWGRNDHIIYDIKTKKRINHDSDIVIGDNNWICQKVSFLPNARIENNNVIGYGSLINKKYKVSNALIAGIPAKVKRKKINWSRSSSYELIDFNNCLKVLEEKDNGF